MLGVKNYFECEFEGIFKCQGIFEFQGDFVIKS